MRLVSFRSAGSDLMTPWRPGLVQPGGLSDLTVDGAGVTSVRTFLALDPASRDRIAETAARRAVIPIDDVALGPPVPDPDKILCIGLNYVDHAAETQLEPPVVPTVFAKFRNSLIGSGQPIVIPTAARDIDYEGELAVVIGRRCRRVSTEEAHAHLAGVMPLNDVSARDLQFQSPQWTVGKAVDTFAPCGPELVSLDEAGDVQALTLQTLVNGEVVQEASTADMIFSVAQIVAFLSSTITLEVGDVIATGTPAGVGFTRTPPLWLRLGDVVDVAIDGIGRLSNTVTAE